MAAGIEEWTDVRTTMREPGPGVADVWAIDLDDAAADALAPVLSAEEERRAAAFRTLSLQQHFRRCRGALRRILAQYTGQAPAQIAFRYAAFGKPALAEGDWHFNVSHSAQQALVAVSREVVGVDLERVHCPPAELPSLIELVCHAQEKSALDLLDGAARQALFYQMWTRKEAYCKAHGKGLQDNLRAILPTLADDGAWRRVCDGPALTDFYVLDIEAAPGFAASLCSTRRNLQLRVRPWSATAGPD